MLVYNVFVCMKKERELYMRYLEQIAYYASHTPEKIAIRTSDACADNVCACANDAVFNGEHHGANNGEHHTENDFAADKHGANNGEHHGASATTSTCEQPDCGQLTYGQLWQASENLALYLETLCERRNAQQNPIMVYGHKNPLMIACFLACLKSGHPYVPVDKFSVPESRVANIAKQLSQDIAGTQIIFALDNLPSLELEGAGGLDSEELGNNVCVIDKAKIQKIAAIKTDIKQEDATKADATKADTKQKDATKADTDPKSQTAQTDKSYWSNGEDLAYILFTSGSTGTPKGVMVTCSCIDNFCDWALSLCGAAKAQGLWLPQNPENVALDLKAKVFLNQAPFSFDLSVYELAMSFSCGGSIYCLTKQTQDSMAKQLQAFKESNVQVWVSTPSFANMCLADKSFNENLLPELETFLFCGETLPNQTVLKLQERFPKAKIINSYGPTESTVAVAATEISHELAMSDEALPVGIARKGTCFHIVNEQGKDLPQGEFGEIIIEGNTVAKGYFKRADLTEKAFGKSADNQCRTYRTGDEGCLDKNGTLHYHGRLDLQIKLNGFRIELGDIEGNLSKLPEVAHAAVVPAYKSGNISHLVAYVVSAQKRSESDFKEGLKLKEQLKESLPHYMIPKKIIFVDALPTTPNGKIDRKALQNFDAKKQNVKHNNGEHHSAQQNNQNKKTPCSSTTQN